MGIKLNLYSHWSILRTCKIGVAVQCKAITKKGRQCHNNALAESRFCNVHKNNFDRTSLIEPSVTVVGGIIGNVVAPGIGGFVVGGVLGNIAGVKLGEDKMAKKKVFISFDFDNDRQLKDFIIGQSRLADSPFEVIDHSLKEAAPEHNWETKANLAIRRSEIVIVMVGPQTYRAQGVLKEVNMARSAGRKIVQVIGYKNGNYKPVPNAGRLYSWNWDNLRRLLA